MAELGNYPIGIDTRISVSTLSNSTQSGTTTVMSLFSLHKLFNHLTRGGNFNVALGFLDLCLDLCLARIGYSQLKMISA